MKKYISNYNSFRVLLQFLSYGCYHKAYYKQRYQLSSRTYEDNLTRIRLFLPKDKLHEVRHQRHIISSIRGDTYFSCENYLINSYRVKNLLPSTAFYFILLMQIFSETSTPLSLNDLWNHPAFSHALPKGLSSNCAQTPALKIDESTLRRSLRELKELGFLVSSKRNRELVYSIPNNPLSNLSPGDVQALYYAIGFYKNIALLSVPGFFLEDTLSAMYPQIARSAVPCQFTDNSFSRILDDELIDTILDSIRKKAYLRFFYHNRHPKGRPIEYIARPIRIETDFFGGSRQYLVAFAQPVSDERMRPLRFRLDRIQFARVSIPVVQQVLRESNVKKNHTLSLRFSFDTAFEENYLRQAVLDRCPEARLSPSVNDSFLCTLAVPDARHYYPWIRTFFPNVEVLPDSTGNVRKNIANDIEEALRNYGEVIS